MLRAWGSFYVLIGAAGSTLIGIEFIVITLVATLRSRQTSEETLGAFATPTVVHFAAAIVLAAIMTAPWPSLLAAGLCIAVCGIAAFAYAVSVMHRTRRQVSYQPERSDWFWYVILPCNLYGALTAAALLLPVATEIAAFVLGAAALGLLLNGIHNAWDTVTYLVLHHSQE
jgi:hypothetical protein